MAANSAIEWTERTWQVTAGCLHRSPGCDHCYAEVMAKRLKAMAQGDIAKRLRALGRGERAIDPGRKRHYIDVISDAGHWNGNVFPLPEALIDPLRWRKPSQVFVDSMSDLFFGDEADRKLCEAKKIPFRPVPLDFVAAVFGTIARSPRHTFQVLTKRAGRARDFLTDYFEDVAYPVAWCAGKLANYWPGSESPELADLNTWPLPNVHIGCSAENQQQAIIRHRSLVDVPAAVRWWSLEPLLGPIEALPLKGIHWVVVGGESGPGARACNVEWIRDIVRQCRDAQVPVFVKQMGARPINSAGEQLRYRDKKGGDIDTWPSDLRVREMPAGVR